MENIRSRRSWPAGALVALGATALLAGCGGGGGGANAAATTTTTVAGAAGDFAAYRQCLIDNGVTLPQRNAQGGQPPADGQAPQGAAPADAPPPSDGQAGAGGGPGGGRGGLGGLDQNDPVVAKALTACQDKRPAPGAGGRGGGQLSQATKDCLAGKGVTVPDSQPLNRSDPAVQAALQACRPVRPTTSAGPSASSSTSATTTAAG
jgi:hypothetical protein